jgi:BirA family biotin operon repressor/biotin-[acetyl-CoA-carboxylase] ligase
LRRTEVSWHDARTEALTLSMTDRPLHWGAEALWQQLEPLLPGLSVEVIEHVDSTNSHLLQRYRGSHGNPNESAVPGRRAADHQPCLLVAEHQSVGRGRMGRSWTSARGASLTFSLAAVLAADDWAGLSLAVGVALAEALDPPTPGAPDSPPQVGLKWPNDLWFDERKLGGILIETLAMGSRRLAVIGIGLNVLPMENTPAFSTGYACVSELDPQADLPSTLHKVGLPMARALREFERGGFAAFRERYARRDALRGRQVRSGTVEGTAMGVADNGGLQVMTDAGLQVVTSSEVSVRLSSWGPTTQSGGLPSC